MKYHINTIRTYPTLIDSKIDSNFAQGLAAIDAANIGIFAKQVLLKIWLKGIVFWVKLSGIRSMACHHPFFAVFVPFRRAEPAS